MILAPVALAVLAMTATGLVLFHRLVVWLTPPQQRPPRRDLLLLGLLPGLALVGLGLTLLALLHLLYGWVLLALAVAVLVLLRRDASAMLTALRESVAEIASAARQGNLFPVLAVVAFVSVAVMGLNLALVPGDNPDITIFHLPLARSMVAHHGLVFPQVPHMFYGNQPHFFELMAATVMLAVDHHAAAGAIYLAIYLGLLLLLLSFVPRGRGFAFLMLCVAMVWLGPFFVQAVTPMIDVPRNCFSIGAYLFAYRYACRFRRLDLALSGLLAGAAVAGKYTELLTPLLICAVLMPLMLRRRGAWKDVAPAAILFAALSGTWYVKNLILYGNPIYPFLLGHPGLSEEWMHGLMVEMTNSTLPEDRIYSRDLFTLRGWHDFAAAWWAKFRGLVPVVMVALAGLAAPLPRRWMLPLWSAVLFVIWYALMFNARRWAMPASLLAMAYAFLVLVWVAGRLCGQWEATVSPGTRRSARLAASGVAVALFLAGAFLWSTGRGAILMPRWHATACGAALCQGPATKG
jgi:hypothetical protein